MVQVMFWRDTVPAVLVGEAVGHNYGWLAIDGLIEVSVPEFVFVPLPYPARFCFFNKSPKIVSIAGAPLTPFHL